MAVDLSMSVLVVDDYSTMIRIIRNLLKQLGFENIDDASDGQDYSVKLWYVPTGEMQASLEEHAGIVWAVKFSPSGRILASAGEDGLVRLWDREKQKHEANISPPVFAFTNET